MKLAVNIELNLKIPEVEKMVDDAVRQGLRDIVVKVHEASTIGSPKKTGTNMRSIAAEVSGMGMVAGDNEERVVDDFKIEGAVYSTSGYGGWLEVGTNPHLISVKTAKVLTDGKTFFGKQVRHPGTAPHPYFKPALDKSFTAEKFVERAKRYLK